MYGGAKASGVRRCVRHMCGAGLGRPPSNSRHSFSLKFWCAQLYWGKQGRIAFRNIMLMQMWFGCKWRRRIIGECNCRFLDAL